MAHEELKLKNQICHRLYMALNGTTRLYRPYLKPLGLTYPQYVIMMALWEQDDVTMGELAQTTCVDKGFLATTIENMKSKGFVKIRQDESDKRKKYILLTPKGRKLEDQAKDIPKNIMKHLGGEKADKKSAEHIMQLLDQINAALKVHGS